MPTAGTHITVIEHLALHHDHLKPLIGDPAAAPGTPQDMQLRYAKLGAIGPDLFYMLGDFNKLPAASLQNLENFLVKVGGTLSCMNELAEKVDQWLTGALDEITAGMASELEATSALFSSVISNGFLALLVESGVNVFSLLSPPRQEDEPVKHWFWADCLHYLYTGEFVQHLIDEATKHAADTGDKKLLAYSLGYLSHYVTDVVGHPYVNQVVHGPYRMHWQRHHLVENFIDAYVWDRWHHQHPDPGGTKERPLDTPAFTPNPTGNGAPMTQARLHDHIDIGGSSLGDPVDDVIGAVCEKIEKGLFDIGILEDTDMEPPGEKDFQAWCNFMADAVREFFGEGSREHPTLLDAAPDPRLGGFPSAEDVAGAYGVLRLLLKISTEDGIEPPTFPDIAGDITDTIEQTIQDILNDIGGIPPVPTPDFGGSFSLDALLDALADILQWVGEVLAGIGKALVDLIKGLADTVAILVTAPIKILLWMLNSALYAAYRYFHDILMLNAYSLPFTEQLFSRIGGLNTTDLWVSKGNQDKGLYPAEEDIRERDFIGSSYRPYMTPATPLEMPAVGFPAPYQNGDRPEAFLEVNLGPDNMFSGSAPQTWIAASGTFDAASKMFGGAIANSYAAIMLTQEVDKDYLFPNFDMDGDRGYAWPDWSSKTPLDPTDPTWTGNPVDQRVHVAAVEVE